MTHPRVALINVVALSPALARRVPVLQRLAESGGAIAPLRGVFPALTCSAQATMLTGKPARDHGVVANGWYRPEVGEVRSWIQARKQIQAPVLDEVARERAKAKRRPFTSARLFWWFAQGADNDLILTPKPHYGCDGDKRFDVQSRPEELAAGLERQYGAFPFNNFWGPMAGLAATRWIADASAEVIRSHKPELSLVYLPHLDYDLQRYGPEGADLPRLLSELDGCLTTLLEACNQAQVTPVVVSEYGIQQVDTPVFVNRHLRTRGWLGVRDGPFGEVLDVMDSRAFAVCDHQVAHVYLKRAADHELLRDLLFQLPGIEMVLCRRQQAEFGIDHANAGDFVLMAEPGHWLAYPYWLDDAKAPDFARTVDIHRKPGFDPCELFFDPALRAPRLRAAWRLLQKKAGLRTRFDVVPLDATLVRGSHGRLESDPQEGPVLVVPDAGMAGGMTSLEDVFGLVLGLLDLNGGGA